MNKEGPKFPGLRDTAGWEGILVSPSGKPCFISPAGERLALGSVAMNVLWPKCWDLCTLLLPAKVLTEATLTLTQNSRVMKETMMRKNRKNMRNHALQCSQLLSPIMRMYSCGRETASHRLLSCLHASSFPMCASLLIKTQCHL